MHPASSCLAVVLSVLVQLGACSRRSSADLAPAGSTGAAAPSGRSAPLRAERCIVHLHGKSGRGGPDELSGGVLHLRPNGNADGWGGRQWLYFPESNYAVVRELIGSAIRGGGCREVVVHGFSNGAAAAAKLFCRGERFADTVRGYVIDDPVTDHAVEGCQRPSDVKVKLYWTGALATAVDGWDCAKGDWTCEGGTSIGIARYAAALGVAATPSPNSEHRPYESPPEYRSFW